MIITFIYVKKQDLGNYKMWHAQTNWHNNLAHFHDRLNCVILVAKAGLLIY